jgi:hypothetical protein
VQLLFLLTLQQNNYLQHSCMQTAAYCELRHPKLLCYSSNQATASREPSRVHTDPNCNAHVPSEQPSTFHTTTCRGGHNCRPQQHHPPHSANSSFFAHFRRLLPVLA